MAAFVRQKRQSRFYWAELGFMVLGLFGLQPTLFTNFLLGTQAKQPSFIDANIEQPGAWNGYGEWAVGQVASHLLNQQQNAGQISANPGWLPTPVAAGLNFPSISSHLNNYGSSPNGASQYAVGQQSYSNGQQNSYQNGFQNSPQQQYLASYIAQPTQSNTPWNAQQQPQYSQAYGSNAQPQYAYSSGQQQQPLTNNSNWQNPNQPSYLAQANPQNGYSAYAPPNQPTTNTWGATQQTAYPQNSNGYPNYPQQPYPGISNTTFGQPQAYPMNQPLNNPLTQPNSNPKSTLGGNSTPGNYWGNSGLAQKQDLYRNLNRQPAGYNSPVGSNFQPFQPAANTANANAGAWPSAYQTPGIMR